MRLPRLRLAMTDGFGYVSQRHCVSDCHPFTEFILSEAEGLWASAYFVARNDDVTTTNAPAIVIRIRLVDHPLSASIERGALAWSGRRYSQALAGWMFMLAQLQKCLIGNLPINLPAMSHAADLEL